MVKIKKKKTGPLQKLDHRLTGRFEDLSDSDKLLLLKQEYELAKTATPDYEKLRGEINEYHIELIKEPDITDFSEINRIYALCQSYQSRVTTIEIIAIGNCNNWKTICSDVKMYIKDLEWNFESKESDILLTSEVKKLTGKLQKAHITKKLIKEQQKINKANQMLTRLQNKLSEAETFREIIELKKKDLISALMNLTRQVKALSLELSQQTRGKE